MAQEQISQFDRKFNAPGETYRQVQSVTLRDAIDPAIRWEGMQVYVIDDSTTYELKGGTDNTFWTAASGFDADAFHKTAGSEIASLTEKTSLSPDDVFLIEDSQASFAKKRVTRNNAALGAGITTFKNMTETTVNTVGNTTIMPITVNSSDIQAGDYFEGFVMGEISSSDASSIQIVVKLFDSSTSMVTSVTTGTSRFIVKCGVYIQSLTERHYYFHSDGNSAFKDSSGNSAFKGFSSKLVGGTGVDSNVQINLNSASNSVTIYSYIIKRTRP